LATCLAAAPAAAETHVFETEHYRVHVDGTAAEAERAARVLEAAWPAYESHFGGAPKLKRGERLTVRFLRDRAAWAQAIRADGTRPPSTAGGYYWPGSRTAYMYRQPTVYFTRTLLLHEAAHQFHYLARTRNRSPTANWYTEGVAEHLSWHRWDGERLQLAVVPGVTLKDYPAAALKEVRAPDFDLGAIVDGSKPASRAVTWALYGYLATGDDGEPLPGFATFRRKMDAGGKAAPLFRRHIGPPKRVREDLAAWLERSQTPFAPVFNEWEQIGEGRMRGYAGVVSACRVKDAASSIRATLEVPEGERWRGGLLLHWTSAQDYTVGLYDARGTVRVNRRVGNRWQRLHWGRRARSPHARAHRLEAVRRGEDVEFRVDGRRVGAWRLPGTTFGLALESSDLRFRDVAWK
jgi:hypothetical protein